MISRIRFAFVVIFPPPFRNSKRRRHPRRIVRIILIQKIKFVKRNPEVFKKIFNLFFGLLSFKFPADSRSADFGGNDTTICMSSGHTSPSIISMPFRAHKFLNIFRATSALFFFMQRNTLLRFAFLHTHAPIFNRRIQETLIFPPRKSP